MRRSPAGGEGVLAISCARPSAGSVTAAISAAAARSRVLINELSGARIRLRWRRRSDSQLIQHVHIVQCALHLIDIDRLLGCNRWRWTLRPILPDGRSQQEDG